MKKLLILLALLCSSCRSSEKLVGHFEAAECKTVAKVEKRDSLAFNLHLQVDSPQIEVDYLDTPRRRVTLRARRATAVAAQTQTLHVQTDSLATKSAQKNVRVKSAPPFASNFVVILPFLAILLLLRRNKS